MSDNLAHMSDRLLWILQLNAWYFFPFQMFLHIDTYILKGKKLAESIHEPEKLAVKCLNGDDKNSRQEYVNHEIYDEMTYLLKKMILVCVYFI